VFQSPKIGGLSGTFVIGQRVEKDDAGGEVAVLVSEYVVRFNENTSDQRCVLCIEELLQFRTLVL
jgi:hypothetical protein